MTQKGKEFLEAVSKDTDLKETFRKITDIKEAIAFAKEHGFDLAEADLKTEGAVSDDDLDSVAGGVNGMDAGHIEACGCFMGGPLSEKPRYCGEGINTGDDIDYDKVTVTPDPNVNSDIW